MAWLIKPNLKKPFHRMRVEAAHLDYPPPIIYGNNPDVTEPPATPEGIFMSSISITPEYPTGSDTTDVFVGAIYIDTASATVFLKALLGSTKSGTAVTLKAKTSFSTAAAAVTGGTLTTSVGLDEITSGTAITSVVGYYYFYLSCASAECSWQCPSITLVA